MAYQPAPPRIIVSRRTPPVAFLLIVTYLYHSTPRIVPSVEHIRKRCVFIRCSQRRRTSILCLRCRYLFLANPWGGGKLIVSHIQLSLARRRYDYLHKDMVLSPIGSYTIPFCLDFHIWPTIVHCNGSRSIPPHVQSWRIRSCNTGS